MIMEGKKKKKRQKSKKNTKVYNVGYNNNLT